MFLIATKAIPKVVISYPPIAHHAVPLVHGVFLFVLVHAVLLVRVLFLPQLCARAALISDGAFNRKSRRVYSSVARVLASRPMGCHTLV
jgi:hypothetical protein